RLVVIIPVADVIRVIRSVVVPITDIVTSIRGVVVPIADVVAVVRGVVAPIADVVAVIGSVVVPVTDVVVPSVGTSVRREHEEDAERSDEEKKNSKNAGIRTRNTD